MLLTDTNILHRISQGQAMSRVQALRLRGVRLATTERNAFEHHRTLTQKLGLSTTMAAKKVDWATAPFEMVFEQDYAHLRDHADSLLREGGKSDWPALAAAMALQAAIWSDDVDYFGVGVPIWSTPNVHLYEEAIDD